MAQATAPHPSDDTADRRRPSAVPEPPNDIAAEAALIGAVLLTATADNDQAIALLEQAPGPEDYYRPAHSLLAQHLTAAADAGEPLEPRALVGRLTDAHDLRDAGGDTYLLSLLHGAAVPASVPHYADRVRRLARIRRLATTLNQAHQRLYTATADDALDAVVDAADHLDTAVQTEVRGARRFSTLTVETIDQVLAGDDNDDDYDWIVPGLFERGDRLIVTGPEGGGKSTFLRQLAFQLAAGVHPFDGPDFAPIRVLYIDCENSRRQFRRKARPLRVKLGSDLEPDRLQVSFRTAGLDLTQPADVDWLDRHVAGTAPDILLTGPIYKLANGDPTEEKSAKPVAMALDRMREKYGTAVVLEAHSAKALGGAKKRSHEPYGWSGWLRWPEFGIWLDEDGEIDHWRGMRDERQWPEMLQRGGSWPWTVSDSNNANRWLRIRECILTTGQRLSERRIAELTGIPRSSVNRILGEYALQYQGVLTQIAGGE